MCPKCALDEFAQIDVAASMHPWQCAKGAVLGIEPRTSRTLSENHTTRPNSHYRTIPSCHSTPYRTRANTESAYLLPEEVLSCGFLRNRLFGEGLAVVGAHESDAVAGFSLRMKN